MCSHKCGFQTCFYCKRRHNFDPTRRKSQQKYCLRQAYEMCRNKRAKGRDGAGDEGHNHARGQGTGNLVSAKPTKPRADQ